MAELEIKGSKRYISYLSKHLKKEHPSTRKRMEVELNGGKEMKAKMKKTALGNTEFVSKELMKKPKEMKVKRVALKKSKFY